MSDPPSTLDRLAPIGPAPSQGHHATAVSAREHARQKRKIKSGLPAPELKNGHAALRTQARAVQANGAYDDAVLTVKEQVDLASTLVNQFGHLAKGSSDGTVGERGAALRLMDRKQAAVAWAVAQDKLILLQGRPPRPDDQVETDDKRDALRELARLLAGYGSSDQLPTTADAK